MFLLNNGDTVKKIFNGIILALVVTFIAIFVLSILMIFIDISSEANVIVNVFITAVSVFLGTVYSARKISRKGWVVGLSVAVGYIACLFIIYAIFNGGVELNIKDLFRTIMALLVGIFSGMLGINI